MEQSLLEVGEDEYMSLRNAIHGCPDMGRVFYVLLQLNIVLEIASDNVFENELLPLVSEVGRQLGFSILFPPVMHRTDAKETVNLRRAVHTPNLPSGRSLGKHFVNDIEYGSAVRRCINGDFPRQKIDLDDEDFRQEVYSGVVSLLEKDLSHT